MMFMVVVNYPGTWDHVYAPFLHAHWNGFTPTDFVFPNFLFVVGVSIAIALSRRKAASEPTGRIMAKILKRGAILFGLGLLIAILGNNFDFAHLRIPGVLQRIAVVFVIASFLFLKLSGRGLAITAGVLLLAYYAVMNFVPVPGHGPANLGPETNLGAWLDRAVFGTNHLWSGTKTWDPEGLLSTVPSVATGILGVLAGILMLSPSAPGGKLKRLFGYGALLTAAGLLAHFAFPINKSLWTSSYVLFAGGLSLIVLGAAYWFVDLKGYKGWTPVVVAFGVNAIFAYMLSELFFTLLSKIVFADGRDLATRIYQDLYAPLFSDPKSSSLLFAFSMLALYTPVLWIMYKRKIIVKV